MVVSYHRPTKVIVDLAAITENVSQAVQQQQGKRAVFAVVKANGYGHGAVPVAKAAVAGGVTGFCVATLDEGIALRQSGITEEILILGIVEVHWLPLILEYDFAIPVATLEWLEEAWDYYNHQQLTGELRVHLSFDTGMGRIGFQNQETLLRAVHWLEEHSPFLLEGVFTHFATADMADTDYWEMQNQRFKTALAALPRLPRYIHGSNSATALWHEDCGNLVRLGMSMYGNNPSGNVLPQKYPLQPALALESALVQVKQVPQGEGIGYGKTYETTETQWIGTVPIGYADGYVRGMQGFAVLVEGHRCEIIGRVCMDQLMIRLPQAFSVGTKVTLIGENKGDTITVQEIADYLGTIHYEVICLLSERIPREYQMIHGVDQ
ncbi:alanine racemase [Enterococcus sp. LJL98]